MNLPVLREELVVREGPRCTRRAAELVKVISVEADATRVRSHAMLSTPFGGNIQARLVDGELIPEHALYRVMFGVETLPGDLASQIRRGRVVIQAGAESMLASWSR